MICPCGSKAVFADCCEPLLQQQAAAETPEKLMRSRYSAFATGNLDYVVATTDPQARADVDVESIREWMAGAEFTGLEILHHTSEGNKGTVEFKASYKMAGGDHVHYEVSKFRKHAGVWYFRDGKVLPEPRS